MQETPSPFTIQEEELIALEEEDRLMREDPEHRMNVPGRTQPGGVCQGRSRASKSINPYPYKMALGQWSSQHAAKFQADTKRNRRRGQPIVVPGKCGDKANNTGGRGGAASGSTKEDICLLPAFSPQRTAGGSLETRSDKQGSSLGSLGSGEHAAARVGTGGPGSNLNGGGGQTLGASCEGCS